MRSLYLIGLLYVFSNAVASRVLELSDRFIDISQEGQWLVKFYAPWCAHCRRLEPIWGLVAQALYNTPIKIAKVDCTRFPAVATHFQVRAYPTILFLKGSFQHEFVGERTLDELVNYALRMSQPAVQRVTHGNSINYLKETHPIFFGYIGKETGPLWEIYSNHAEKYQPHSWFYVMSHEVVKRDINHENAVFVYKDNSSYVFEVDESVMSNKEHLNSTLDKWINAERFGTFPKITRSNINQLMDTEKYLVLVVVSENKLNEISQTEKDFKDMVEGIIRSRKQELHKKFQFGWIGSPELANSIAMSELSVPHLLVLNSTTSHHHIPEDDPVLMTPEAIAVFLDQICNQMAPIMKTQMMHGNISAITICINSIEGQWQNREVSKMANIWETTYGGNSWPVRMYRGFFEARTTLVNMWRGNPVLTALVFGLPLGFLSLICYSVCCADILDAEEEEPPEPHEKKD